MPALRMAPPVSLDGMEDRTAAPQVEPMDEFALPKPKAPAPLSPTPLTPPPTGAAGAAQSVAPPQTTTDPLAFATPGAPIVPPAPPPPAQPPPRIAPPDGPANTTPAANAPPFTLAPPSPPPITTPVQGMGAGDVQGNSRGGPTPLAPTMSTQDWGNYSPIQSATAGLTGAAKEKAITDYWAGRNVEGLANVGYTPSILSGAGGVLGDPAASPPFLIDPAASAAATETYKANNAQSIADITKQVQGGQADALAATNREQDAIGFDTAVKDANVNLASIRAAGGTAGGPVASESFLEQQIRSAGFDPSGAPVGGPAVGTGQRTPGGTGATSAAEDALNAISPPGPATPQAGLPSFGPTWAPPSPAQPAGISPGDIPPVSPVTTSPVAPIAPIAPGAPPSGTTAGGAPPYVANDIDPDDSLLGKEIQAGPTADRMKIAQDAWDNYRKSTDRGFQADSETIAAQSFGRGRGVSGMNRTRLGNLALARQNELDTKGVDFLNAATTGSIDDAFRKVGIAQQQQGFQKGLYDTAFDQEKDRALLEDALTNSAFGRALSQQTAGYADSPEQIGLILSKIFGDQSSAAARAAAEAFKAAGQASGGSFDPIAWAKKYFAEHPEVVKEAQRGVDTPPDDGTRVA